MPKDSDQYPRLRRSLEKQIGRLRKAERERPTLLSQTVYLGTVGLLFVLPVIGGAYLGRWLDELSENFSARWTLSLIFVGVVFGAVNVYFYIRE